MRTRLPLGSRGLVLAVSGGPDSLALLAFVAEARRRLALGPILVVTVDHGLRAESAAEAVFVAERAARFGLAHRTLVWQRSASTGNLSAQARDGRYALLVEAARETGAACVVTAHHEDDQIETHLIARERGEGALRQAGMRWRRDLSPGILLCRPLLDVPKVRLRASLRARGIAWIDDPTNSDLRYARARIRANPWTPCERQRHLAAIGDAAAERDRLEAALYARLAGVRVSEEGAVSFEPWLIEGDEEPAGALLSRALRAAGGGARAASGAEIERLLADLRARTEMQRTLGGCFVTRDARRVCVGREFGRHGPADVEAPAGGRTLCFDERFDIDTTPHPSARLVPLGGLGRGGARLGTLPVLLDANGTAIAAHPAVLGRLPAGVEPLRLRERATWRLYRDLAPSLQNAAKAPPPVGKDFAADYLSGKSTKRVRADDPVEGPETQSQDG